MLAVIHREWGRGYAICFRECGDKTFVVVKFGEETKEFSFPDCFVEELATEDPEIGKQMLAEYSQS